MLTRLSIFIIALAPNVGCSQSDISLSVPMIWSTVTVKDNWTPPTAPAYKEYLDGSAIGYGANLNYHFRPQFLIKNKNFSIAAGVGYFNQSFHVTRPFNYSSEIYIIFYTDHYTYHCLQGLIGLVYAHPFNKNFSLSGQLAYVSFHSFKQKYTPTREDFPSEKTSSKFSFGDMVSLSVAGQQVINTRLSIKLGIVAPLHIKWRNDEIFDDDPTTFFHPKFSLGTAISVVYHLKN